MGNLKEWELAEKWDLVCAQGNKWAWITFCVLVYGFIYSSPYSYSVILKEMSWLNNQCVYLHITHILHCYRGHILELQLRSDRTLYITDYCSISNGVLLTSGCPWSALTCSIDDWLTDRISTSTCRWFILPQWRLMTEGHLWPWGARRLTWLFKLMDVLWLGLALCAWYVVLLFILWTSNYHLTCYSLDTIGILFEQVKTGFRAVREECDRGADCLKWESGYLSFF